MRELVRVAVSRLAPGRTATTTDRGTLRRLSYAPELDGAADPGEVVWALVAFEEGDGRVKDRPLLVVGRKDEHTVLALMLSSRLRRGRDRDWLDLGRGAWDGRRRRSFVRLDRVLELHENALRREGAVVLAAQFDQVCRLLRSRYGWS